MQKLLKIYKMVTILKIEKTCDTHVFRTNLGNNPDFALLPQASKKKNAIIAIKFLHRGRGYKRKLFV